MIGKHILVDFSVRTRFPLRIILPNVRNKYVFTVFNPLLSKFVWNILIFKEIQDGRSETGKLVFMMKPREETDWKSLYIHGLDPQSFVSFSAGAEQNPGALNSWSTRNEWTKRTLKTKVAGHCNDKEPSGFSQLRESRACTKNLAAECVVFVPTKKFIRSFESSRSGIASKLPLTIRILLFDTKQSLRTNI